MMRVLIIGLGFVGSNAAALFSERGFNVHAVDINPRILDYVKEARLLSISTADVTDLDSLAEVASGVKPEIIVHTAISPLADQLSQTIRVNVVGLANTLEIARRYDSRVIYLSSGSVYGQLPEKEEPISEAEPLGPIYPQREYDLPWAPTYSTSKRMGESLVELASRLYGLQAIILRLGLVYGRGDSLYNAGLTLLLRRALAKRPLILEYGGDTFCPFVYVKDVAEAILMAASQHLKYGVFNIADQRGYFMREAAEVVEQIIPDAEIRLGPGIWPSKNVPLPRGVISWPTRRRLDISKAVDVLGYSPRYSLYNGTVEYASWMQRNWERYSPSAVPFPDDQKRNI
jgi:nucleoside-diphosphate-sugar epimerase